MQVVSAVYVQAASENMLASAYYITVNRSRQSSLLQIARVVFKQHVKLIQPCDKSEYNFDLLYLLQKKNKDHRSMEGNLSTNALNRQSCSCNSLN